MMLRKTTPLRRVLKCCEVLSQVAVFNNPRLAVDGQQKQTYIAPGIGSSNQQLVVRELMRSPSMHNISPLPPHDPIYFWSRLVSMCVVLDPSATMIALQAASMFTAAHVAHEEHSSLALVSGVSRAIALCILVLRSNLRRTKAVEVLRRLAWYLPLLPRCSGHDIHVGSFQFIAARALEFTSSDDIRGVNVETSIKPTVLDALVTLVLADSCRWPGIFSVACPSMRSQVERCCGALCHALARRSSCGYQKAFSILDEWISVFSYHRRDRGDSLLLLLEKASHSDEKGQRAVLRILHGFLEAAQVVNMVKMVDAAPPLSFSDHPIRTFMTSFVVYKRSLTWERKHRKERGEDTYGLRLSFDETLVSLEAALHWCHKTIQREDERSGNDRDAYAGEKTEIIAPLRCSLSSVAAVSPLLSSVALSKILMHSTLVEHLDEEDAGCRQNVFLSLLMAVPCRQWLPLVPWLSTQQRSGRIARSLARAAVSEMPLDEVFEATCSLQLSTLLADEQGTPPLLMTLSPVCVEMLVQCVRVAAPRERNAKRLQRVLSSLGDSSRSLFDSEHQLAREEMITLVHKSLEEIQRDHERGVRFIAFPKAADSKVRELFTVASSADGTLHNLEGDEKDERHRRDERSNSVKIILPPMHQSIFIMESLFGMCCAVESELVFGVKDVADHRTALASLYGIFLGSMSPLWDAWRCFPHRSGVSGKDERVRMAQLWAHRLEALHKAETGLTFTHEDQP